MIPDSKLITQPSLSHASECSIVQMSFEEITTHNILVEIGSSSLDHEQGLKRLRPSDVSFHLSEPLICIPCNILRVLYFRPIQLQLERYDNDILVTF